MFFFPKKENYMPLTWHYAHATIIGLTARWKKENEMTMYKLYNFTSHTPYYLQQDNTSHTQYNYHLAILYIVVTKQILNINR